MSKNLEHKLYDNTAVSIKEAYEKSKSNSTNGILRLKLANKYYYLVCMGVGDTPNFHTFKGDTKTKICFQVIVNGMDRWITENERFFKEHNYSIKKEGTLVDYK